jgi:hypothetical protein
MTKFAKEFAIRRVSEFETAQSLTHATAQHRIRFTFAVPLS